MVIVSWLYILWRQFTMCIGLVCSDRRRWLYYTAHPARPHRRHHASSYTKCGCWGASQRACGGRRRWSAFDRSPADAVLLRLDADNVSGGLSVKRTRGWARRPVAPTSGTDGGRAAAAAAATPAPAWADWTARPLLSAQRPHAVHTTELQSTVRTNTNTIPALIIGANSWLAQ